MKPNTCEVQQKRADYSNGYFVLEYPSCLDMDDISIPQMIEAGQAYFVRDKQNKPLFVPFDQMRDVLADQKGRAFNWINLNTLPVKEIMPIYREKSRYRLALLSRESLLRNGLEYITEL